MTKPRGLWLFTVAILSFVGSIANGSLGEPASTAVRDCEALHGQLSATNNNGVQACSTSSYTILFHTNITGLIDQISWKGRTTPPMKLMLGSYLSEYQQTLADSARSTVPHGSSGPRALVARRVNHESAHLSVQRSGHARVHSGQVTLKNPS